MRLAQAEKKEEQIRKMAVLAKAEKAELMAQAVKEDQNLGINETHDDNDDKVRSYKYKESPSSNYTNAKET
jgi:hypothetical protein